ncbi:(deoxy)nucleoside triphosphate pyrophosphohydrolase [Bacillus sp. FJAT-49736]|uniref:(deoxy)nucleoside triphosphate pyrophosphohydrolase n=1 Tax=Bacillus sp. FJAT-49736 TaxID=2833582 RepID=UPI001BCA66FB|nr:(deoxy)nucleoside triphosphate pyrophosphohydrolase [Bacillus sp. FJAT-49736]MBS4172871.1 (deoxy)nucleoside triphosphate pyrophosphohydrolase [Bacillus sp. FJAT-49736]
MKKTIKVVAAIIENDSKEILCALRSPKMVNPNRWEFPGGKVEKEEDIYSALVREIDEELNSKIETHEIHNELIHEYDTFLIHLIAIKCSIVEGIPTPKEHSSLLWLKRENLDSLKWAPADVPAVELLMEEN